MMNTLSQPEQPTSAAIDQVAFDLPEALLRHVQAGRLSPERAKMIHEELEYRTHIISLHRDAARQANAGFFKANPYDGPVDPNHAVFSATKDRIAHNLATFAEAVTMRFAMPDHPYFHKTDIAFDFGHTDQSGDWQAPAELDELITLATDERYLQKELHDDRIKVVLHSRDHEKINYEFWNIDLKAAAMIIRKRPYADIALIVNDEPVCIQIFRKSWFLINADMQDRELRKLMHTVHPEKQMAEPANVALTQYLNEVLADAQKTEQSAVLPCTMTYIARVVDAKRIADKVASRKIREGKSQQ